MPSYLGQKKKLIHSRKHTENLSSQSLEEYNKHLIKHVPSTSEDQKKLFLIKIKPLRPSSKTKVIHIYLKDVKSLGILKFTRTQIFLSLKEDNKHPKHVPSTLRDQICFLDWE